MSNVRARIEDVARAAGVSTKSVSRVLNGEPHVRASTRDRILAAMRELDYRPDPSARSLAANRSFTLALLYDRPSPSCLLEFQTGVLEACEAQHFSMMVRSVPLAEGDPVGRVEALLAQHRPAGLVLTPPLSDHDGLLSWLDGRGVAHACVSSRLGEDRIGAALDEQRAVRDMVDHLVGLGHTRIAYVGGPNGYGASVKRLRGYRDALRHAGLRSLRAWRFRGTFGFESGVEAGRRLLALSPRPTAVVAVSDEMAAGVMRAALEAGLSVPDDVSVCGFDDVPLARQVWPALTTVRHPCREIGRQAATQLLRRIRGRDHGDMVTVPYVLALRASTGPAPH